MNINKSLIQLFKSSKFKNHDELSKATKIDKSTISLHLSGKRAANLTHANIYAKIFNVPLIKIISNEIIKYPIVAYVNLKGEVNPRGEDDNQILISNNQIQKNKHYCILSRDTNEVFFYEKESNKKFINSSYYIATNKKNYIARFKNNSFENLFTNEIIEDSVESYSLITSIISLKNKDFNIEDLT